MQRYEEFLRTTNLFSYSGSYSWYDIDCISFILIAIVTVVNALYMKKTEK